MSDSAIRIAMEAAVFPGSALPCLALNEIIDTMPERSMITRRTIHDSRLYFGSPSTSSYRDRSSRMARSIRLNIEFLLG